MKNIKERMGDTMEELKCCDCGELFDKNIIIINKDINICFSCVFMINNRVSSFVIANKLSIKYDKSIEKIVARYKNYKMR